MAKGGHRRPVKRKKNLRKETNEGKTMQRLKNREKQSQREKSLIRQMRGMKWDEEEYNEELDEELED